MQKPANIDEYISTFPEATQHIMDEIRKTIQKAAPEAKEVISYSMPAYKMNKVLVYFAGYKNHIGFYPCPSALEEFKKDISIYKNSKGAVQFPLDKPIPLDLITKMVKFRLEEDKQFATVIKKK